MGARSCFASGQGMRVSQAIEDADPLIVGTALELAGKDTSVLRIGEDVDLLVLLTANHKYDNLFLLKPGKGQRDNEVFTPTDCKLSEESKKSILFLHAFSGCESTSAFFRQGKAKCIKIYEKNTSLQKAVAAFLNPCATPEENENVDASFIISMYGGCEESLNEARCNLFQRALIKSHFNLSTLPPTEDAACLHFMRVYYQVQVWINTILDPLQWGWKSTELFRKLGGK